MEEDAAAEADDAANAGTGGSDPFGVATIPPNMLRPHADANDGEMRSPCEVAWNAVGGVAVCDGPCPLASHGVIVEPYMPLVLRLPLTCGIGVIRLPPPPALGVLST